MRTKYVVVSAVSGFPEVRIIPSYGNHSDAVRQDETAIGAGEFYLHIDEGEIKVCCFGRSVSLDVKSRGEEDARVIAQLLRLGAYQYV